MCWFFFFQAEDGIRDLTVTGVQTCALPISQDPLLARPDGHPARVQVLEEGDGVLPGDPEEVLDVSRPDLLPLAQEGDDLVLDRVERRGVEVERLLDPDELPALDEELEELVLVAATHAGAAERLFGTRRRRLGLPELLLDTIHDALLLRRQAHLVGREPDLVPVAREGALGLERGEERREHPLVGAARSHPQLLTRHPGLEWVGAVEGLQGRDRKSTRLNSSHSQISYAVFCLKKKKHT